MVEPAKLRAAAVMCAVGTLFAALAVVTGQLALWGAAAAINFLGANDALRPRPATVPAGVPGRRWQRGDRPRA